MDTDDQILPALPLQKGGITPLWQRGATCLREAASAKAGGRFPEAYVFFIIDSLAMVFELLSCRNFDIFHRIWDNFLNNR